MHQCIYMQTHAECGISIGKCIRHYLRHIPMHAKKWFIGRHTYTESSSLQVNGRVPSQRISSQSTSDWQPKLQRLSNAAVLNCNGSSTHSIRVTAAATAANWVHRENMSGYSVISWLHQKSNTLLMYLRQHYLRCKTVYRGINHLGIELAPGGRASLPQTWGARDDRDTNSSVTGGFCLQMQRIRTSCA